MSPDLNRAKTSREEQRPMRRANKNTKILDTVLANVFQKPGGHCAARPSGPDPEHTRLVPPPEPGRRSAAFVRYCRARFTVPGAAGIHRGFTVLP